MNKADFLELASKGTTSDVISVLRTTMINDVDTLTLDFLLSSLESAEEVPEGAVYLLHSPFGDLEAHLNIPQKDIQCLHEEGCTVIQLG